MQITDGNVPAPPSFDGRVDCFRPTMDRPRVDRQGHPSRGRVRLSRMLPFKCYEKRATCRYYLELIYDMTTKSGR